MTSRTWDRLTYEAAQRGAPVGYYALDGTLLGRTADPRLNPDAVAATDSSTRHRRNLARWPFETSRPRHDQRSTPQ